nr:hypothetical protein [Candidatus Sigynarchaeota archaeon]
MNAQDDPLRPIHARSIIHVSIHGNDILDFAQEITYDYVDTSNGAYFDKVVHDAEFLRQEIATVEKNMQSSLDEEINLVNGARVYPRILNTAVDFKTEPRYPYYTWLIAWNGSTSISGKQVYEVKTEPAALEYSAKSTYILPSNARIVEVDSSLAYENVLKNIIVFRGSRGDMVQEIERIAWIVE